MRNFVVLSTLLLLFGSLTLAEKKLPTEGDPRPTGISTDPTYGVTEKNPIRVGQKNGGPRDEDIYLKCLRGPKGESVQYKRLGGCCFFKTPNALIGDKAMLDRYELTYSGLDKPIDLYLDMYDYEQPLVPIGFTKTS